ncbi:MAG: hypothetical protein DMF61_12200 [Blastocatellia bacterium AA13]|nr:MAG: hypothetical protein DMF61_12200 [Blastocatellia bacterium AA13]
MPRAELFLDSAYAIALSSPKDDKEWGITDCISFVVMRERRLTKALTTDRHFQQAGFRTLLRENLNL